MKQIYRFEQAQPPVLNERMIQLEIDRRRLRLQTALLAFSAALLPVVMILLGFVAFGAYPWIALFCFLHALVSATGGGVLAVVFTCKGGRLIWQTRL